MYPAKVLKDGPAPGSKHLSLNEMIMDADGFAGVFPEHKYEIVKRLQGLGYLCAMTGESPFFTRVEERLIGPQVTEPTTRPRSRVPTWVSPWRVPPTPRAAPPT
jgi:hypothetical protein